MRTRQLGPFEVSAVGLGCMSLSHAYGTPPAPEAAGKLLLDALDMGITHFDTAALYGFGQNESLIGKYLAPHRDKFTLASKCGMGPTAEGTREISNRPDKLRKTCESSLKRLNTDVIDLYYLHRWDKVTPIEEAVGALAELVAEGKIRAIGLSEVSAETLRKAHGEHPIAAVQTEYSLWTRNPEIAVADLCRDIGASLVAFSPLARAFLTGKLRDPDGLEAKDLRRQMPRFSADNYSKNLQLLGGFADVAASEGCSMAELAIAWLIAKSDHILPIPGTTNAAHLAENIRGGAVDISTEAMVQLEALINNSTVSGPRYNAKTQTEIDTEEFA
ncbi:MAG: aldo/keto reductase [Rhodobacteraceae bacterium]|nr:aldo/keto reductase [Paracoccaceae bacterium]